MILEILLQLLTPILVCGTQSGNNCTKREQLSFFTSWQRRFQPDTQGNQHFRHL